MVELENHLLFDSCRWAVESSKQQTQAVFCFGALFSSYFTPLNYMIGVYGLKANNLRTTPCSELIHLHLHNFTA